MNRRWFTILSALAAFGFVTLCGVGCKPTEKTPSPAPTPPSAPTNAISTNTVVSEVAVLKFKDYGDIVVEFLPEVAPKTVANFKKLANEKFYDGTLSHRLIPGFMIQLGDPLTKDPAQEARWGSGDPGYKLAAEFNSTRHARGVLSMARNGDPNERFGQMPQPQFADSAGSQFFICFAAAAHLDGKYTAFAKVLKGGDVLDKLEKIPVGGPQGSKPQTPVTLETVRIVARDTLK